MSSAGVIPQELEKLVGQFEQACRALWSYNSVTFEYCISKDNLATIQEFVDKTPGFLDSRDGQTMQLGRRIAQLEAKVDALEERVKEDTRAWQMLQSQEHMEEEELVKMLKQENIRVQTAHYAAKKDLEAHTSALRTAEHVYETATKRAADQKWSSTAQQRQKSTGRVYKEEQEHVQEAAVRVESLARAEKWLTSLYHRFKVAQRPSTLLPPEQRPGHSSLFHPGYQRPLLQRARPSPKPSTEAIPEEDGDEKAETRALGKHMGLRAARRYWGAGY